MEKKDGIIGFYEEKDGKKSFQRLSIAWYFWGICLPGSLWVLHVFGQTILKNTLDMTNGGIMIAMFVFLQLGWIAPKALSKVSETDAFKALLNSKT